MAEDFRVTLGGDAARFNAALAGARRTLQQARSDAQSQLRQIDRAFGTTGQSSARFGQRVGGASNRMRELAQSAVLVQGPLGGVASRIVALNVAVTQFSPAVAAATLGIAGLTVGLGALIRAGSEAEKSQLQLQALLETTGFASGRTQGQIEALAREIGRNTLASTQGVREAAAQLLTFRSVSGETFDRTLRLSQDLASLGFGSIQTAAVQLAKALEDPARNLLNLRRVGVSFTASQEEMIKAMSEAGRVAEAQAMLLDILEKQVGGAAVGQAGGAAGAVDTLAENLRILTENLAASSGVLDGFTLLVSQLAAAAGAAADAVEALDLSSPPGLMLLPGVTIPLPRRSPADRAGDELVKAAEEELARLGEIAQKRQADLDHQRARATALNEFVAGQERELELARMREDLRRREVAADRAVAAAKREVKDLSAEELRRIRERAMAVVDAEGPHRVDALRAEAQDLEDINAARRRGIADHRLTIELIEEENAARQAGIQLNTPEGREFLDQFRRRRGGQRDSAGLDRDQAIQRQIAGLQRAAALEGLSARQKEVARALLAAQNALLDEHGNKLRDLTEQERQRIEAAVRLRQAVESEIQLRDDLGRAIDSSFDRISEGIAQVVLEGGAGALDFKNIWTAVLLDIAQQMARLGAAKLFGDTGGGSLGSIVAKGIFGLFSGGINYGLGNQVAAAGGSLSQIAGADILANPDIFHRGGIAGVTPAPVRPVPAAAFVRAPRLHTGAPPSMGGNVGRELFAILDRGEAVLTERHQRNAMAMMGGGDVHIHNYAGAEVSTSPRQGGGMDVFVRAAKQAMADDFLGGGEVSRAAAEGFGLSRVPR